MPELEENELEPDAEHLPESITLDLEDEEARESFKSHMLDVLACEHLVMLTGSGTSLGKTLEDAGSPRMGHLLEEAKKLPKYKATRDKFGLDPEDIEKFLSWCLLYIELKQGGHEAIKEFYDACEEMILQKCGYVNTGTPLSAHETFLRKVVRRPRDLPRLQLFTTNYDRAFEEAGSRLGMISLDGFDFSAKPRFSGKHFDLDLVRREEGARQPELLEEVFKLYKVHGSVDWSHSDHGVIRCQGLPPKPVMIYPQAGKYEASYDSPFLEMMSRFQRALRQRNLGLIVAGYGFRDRHINNPLLMALRENRSLKVVLVDIAFDFGNQGDKAQAHNFVKSLATNNPNIAQLVQGDFSAFAQHMPHYMSETEREEYERKLGRER